MIYLTNRCCDIVQYSVCIIRFSQQNQTTAYASVFPEDVDRLHEQVLRSYVHYLWQMLKAGGVSPYYVRRPSLFSVWAREKLQWCHSSLSISMDKTYLLQTLATLTEWQAQVWKKKEQNKQLMAPKKNAMYTAIFCHGSWSRIDVIKK